MSLPQPSGRTIVGVALMLFSSVLMGVGIHHLIATGTCSSNGYSQYGPVQTCPAGTSAWFFFVFGGVIGNVIGTFVAGSPSLIFATLFPAIGLGALTLNFDTHAASSAKTFGLLFGGGFLLAGVISAGALLGSALRGAGRPQRGRTGRAGRRAGAGGTARAGRRAGTGGTSQPPSATTTASNWSAPSPSPSSSPVPSPLFVGQASSQSSGVLDQISRLSDLHTSGALTDAEFEAEKAKLLNRM
jgi:Short C-terminal domain